MKHIEQDLLESSSNSRPENLLEEYWFFGNSLDRKTKKAILRCYSDPCPSSSTYSQDMMLARNSSGGSNSVSMKNFSHNCGVDTPAPLLPPCTVAREDQIKEENTMNKSIPEPSRHNLVRTPSLPPCLGREEDVESDFALSKLIRQASLNLSDVLPPRRNSKVMKQSSSTSRNRPRKNSELESIDSEAYNEMRCSRLDQNRIMRKSLSDLEFKQGKGFKEQGKGFKDFGFKFEQKYSNPSGDKSSAAPPIPIWVDNKSSSAEDMKAHIKFWARAVADNVR